MGFRSMVDLHGLQNFVQLHDLHVAQAVDPQVVVGDPSGDSSHQPTGSTDGAVGPISGLVPSVFFF